MRKIIHHITHWAATDNQNNVDRKAIMNTPYFHHVILLSKEGLEKTVPYFKHTITVLNLYFYHAHEDHETLKK